MKSTSKLSLSALAAIASTLAVLAVVTTGCNNGNNIKFGGSLSGIESDTLIITAFHFSDRTPLHTDTVALKNDRFSITYEDSTMLMAYLEAMPSSDGSSTAPMSASSEYLVLLPGDNIKVSGSVGKPVLRSPKLYDDLAAFKEHSEIMDSMDVLYKKAKNIQQNDNEAIELINAEFEDLDTYKDSIYLKYVLENPDKLASGYFTIHIQNPEKGLEAYNSLGENVIKSPLNEILTENAEINQRKANIKRNKENIKPGKPAPDFSLPDIDGNIRTLSSFQGKYILLDFWGKWCYWCMKGMPDMKKYYDKYNKKIEFVGINCRDSEETWRETVSKEGLRWTNLFNGNGPEIVESYAIEGYPTKILIDSQGNIVEVFVGESDDLYKKLDEIF